MTFNCNQCNKSFSRKDNLNTHIKSVHLKEKKYHCDQCDKSFGQKSKLNVHIKTVHLKQKEFNCKYCDKSFGQKCNLKVHIKTVHLKQKDFNCEHCNYSCGQQVHLNIHINSVHLKQKVFNCDQCEYCCSVKGNLNNHIKLIHENPKPKNMSRGEKKVYDSLIELGLEWDIDFTQEKTFSDLKSYKNRHLRYDFAININAGEMDYLLIEFDGMQHFREVKWQNDQTHEHVQKNFEQIKLHDRIKNKFARVHDYPLLRIKYNENNVFERVREFIADHSNNQFF